MSVRLKAHYDITTDFLEVNVRIPRQLEVECGPAPTRATFGDDWLALTSSEDAERLTELGYWEIESESLAMKFLRLAWMAAHSEGSIVYANSDETDRRDGEDR